jgi:demethylmenaquinone methyltransferase / 2-methoxy-6-polyprenyl-1,4-benzoquinol methylase
MANDFYDSGAARAPLVQRLFATIAPRYDLINDLQSLGLHRRWKRRLTRLAEIQPGDHALDLCCGTGDIAFALAQRGAQTIGLDFSPEMLAVAARRQKHTSSGAPNPAFRQGDAQQLPFSNAQFDVVTMGYGLRNLASWETGLTEMVRVAKPGGRILILEFGKPEQPLWRAIYYTYLRLCVPVLGLVFAGRASAYAYILESLRHYPAQRGVEAKMKTLGLERVRVENIFGGAMSINFGVNPPHPKSNPPPTM